MYVFKYAHHSEEPVWWGWSKQSLSEVISLKSSLFKLSVFAPFVAVHLSFAKVCGDLFLSNLFKTKQNLIFFF